MKKAAVIGSGNVAEALVRALAAAGAEDGTASEALPLCADPRQPSADKRAAVGELASLAVPSSAAYRLVQVAARDRVRGEVLAALGGCAYTDRITSPAQADIYLMAVSDAAIPELAASIDFHGGVVAHTAGGVDISALAPAEHRAVLYPLQTFTAGREVDFRRIPLFIEASTPRALETVEGLAQALSNTVHYTSSELRAQVHLAAVFASNFSNHMYAIAGRILRENGVEFGVLGPLIEECAAKAVASDNPVLTQTGPAVRGDTATQNRHLGLLHDEGLRTIYRTISESIWKTSRKL